MTIVVFLLGNTMPCEGSMVNDLKQYMKEIFVYKKYLAVGTSEVPEPTTAALLMLGLIGVAGFARRKNLL